jgi:hypothetical protein
MKNPTDAGFEQDYNAQVVVDQGSLLIVGWALSNHLNDSQEAEPTLAAIASAIGTPDVAVLDAGYFGPMTLQACAKRGIRRLLISSASIPYPGRNTATMVSFQIMRSPFPVPLLSAMEQRKLDSVCAIKDAFPGRATGCSAARFSPTSC